MILNTPLIIVCQGKANAEQQPAVAIAEEIGEEECAFVRYASSWYSGLSYPIEIPIICSFANTSLNHQSFESGLDQSGVCIQLVPAIDSKR